MNEKRRILSKEDLARARRKMRERDRGLGQVSKSIVDMFIPICDTLDRVFVFAEGEFEFRVIVFFKTDNDLEVCRANGICVGLQEFVFGEIERVGRGTPDKVRISFEFDSDENVTKNYEGSYWYRLH